MIRLSMLFLITFINNNIFCQKEILIEQIELKEESSKNSSDINKLANKLSKDFQSCGKTPDIKKSYQWKFTDLNKNLSTIVFNKIEKVNKVCFYSKSKNDSIGSINIEEYKNAFDKLKVYSKKKSSRPALAPINKFVFLDKNKIIVLSSESFHKYPKEKERYIKWIIDTLFNGKSQDIIELHK
jgi:hypothetical protein